MSVDLVRVASVAAAECVRQHVGLDGLRDLLEAYEYALHLREQDDEPLSEVTVTGLAVTVEPSNGGGYRRTPVTFASGGHAVPHGEVRAAMDALLERGVDLGPTEWVHEFLRIHPFTDGNGRTAWLLLNLLGGTLDEPVPLPDMFGESVTPA